ncbi:carcinine transporter [Cephus cinctus]|uniref:Carcinine transporter n=1 Tax=Cephus cinctus TaxID=211228 RepID=A0AAJ7BNW1_CEPCN|nr:carcinine transporter [Cephus cinctus]
MAEETSAFIEDVVKRPEILRLTNSDREKQKEKRSNVSFDDILPDIGDFGKYQWCLMFALFPYIISYVVLYFSQIFITIVPEERWCKVDALIDANFTREERIKIAIPSNDKYPYYDHCYKRDLNYSELLARKNFSLEQLNASKVIECTEWEYNFTQIPYSSIATELDWVCDREYLISTTQAVFFCGSVIGGILFGWVADHSGRIPALVICNAIAFLGSVSTAFAKSFWSYSLCRFITGLAFDNCVNIPLIIVMEYVAVKRRTWVFNLAFGIYFAFGSTLLPWIAYYIANWKLFALVVSIPFLNAIITPWILPESARWYMANGKINKVVRKVKRIARFNGKNVPLNFYERIAISLRESNKSQETATLLDLFRTPSLAKNTILLIIFWFLGIFTFDGHVYSLKLLQSSVFVSFSLACATELPAGLLLTLILDRWGRRFCGFITMALTGVFTFVELYSESNIIQLSMSILCRFCLNMAANVGHQFVAELLPTTVRGQGVALIHICGIIGHGMAPYIVDTGMYWTSLPLFIIGIASFVAAIISLLLPETVGRNLPQTLEEGENFGKDQKFWSLPCFQSNELD